MTFENFTIRPISVKDSDAYFLLINGNKERLLKYFPKTVYANRNSESTSAHVFERVKLANEKKVITFVILNNLSNEIIGSIFIKDLDWNIPKGELGFFISESYVGKGIITKNLSFIIDYCFQKLEIKKLFMRIAEDNIASRRVAEKNGFIIEGILRNDFKTSENKLIDVVYYGLVPFTK